MVAVPYHLITILVHVKYYLETKLVLILIIVEGDKQGRIQKMCLLISGKINNILLICRKVGVNFL